MLFFKIQGLIDNIEEHQGDVQQMYAQSLQESIEMFYQNHERKVFIFVVGMNGSKILLGAISKERKLLYKVLPEFYREVGLEIIQEKIGEITLKAITSLLVTADRNNFIIDDNEVLDMFYLSDLVGRFGRVIKYREYLLRGDSNKKELISQATKILSEDSLCPEINRIFKGPTSVEVQGHPIHYMIEGDDNNIKDRIIEILLSALYKNSRIGSRRYCHIKFNEGDHPPGQYLDYLYRSCRGGTIVVSYSIREGDYENYSRVGTDIIIPICDIMLKYKNTVLTILSLPRGSRKIKENFYQQLQNASIVEIGEGIVFGEKARNYLLQQADNHGVRPDKALHNIIDKENRGYLTADLYKEFDLWYSKKLKTEMYPQYKQIQSANKNIAKAKPKGGGYLELQNMIGLDGAKDVIGQAINYYKAQRLFKDRGMETYHPSMHMVFTGNPGTAKTTVARLFASIMKDNGLLSKGDLYEVGRSDLVGKYVGWTAQIVRDKFRIAKGSVLFIDEAYSLVDDKEGLYGDEAINTMVQEMENHREDMVVIFAGYPDKMENFLKTNPGLPSRIAFHVNFNDYTPMELYEITKLIAKDKGLMLSKGVKEKLIPIFESFKKKKDFGNGRFSRNLVDRARMKQASRLLSKDMNSITNRDIITLLSEDFEVPTLAVTRQKNKIGFI